MAGKKVLAQKLGPQNKAQGYARMAPRKVLAQKFDKTNKAKIKGRVLHTRTGACTCRRTQKCYHGKTRP